MVNELLIKNMCFYYVTGSFQVSRYRLFSFSHSLRIGSIKDRPANRVSFLILDKFSLNIF